MFAEIAAERLDIPAASIEVFQGCSDDLPRGAGTGGSGSLVVGGRAVASAATRMIEAARIEASMRLECATSDLDYASGAFTIVGTDRAITLAEIATKLGDDGCTGEADFEGSHHTFPNGVYITEVEIDPDTGQVTLASFTAVDDLGRILDLQRTNGQIIGGVVQSIGQSVMEHDRYDLETGQPLTGSLMDYAVPRASDVPDFHLAKRPTPSPTDPMGMKGAGEVGTTGAPPSIIAAITDAIGVRHIDMPATPEKIWRAMQQ
jgi:carbon-monoxide dehydrogenase large subunit